jgi:large subunit ribosomal protein L30
MATATVKVTLIKSMTGRIPNHNVEVLDTPENRGMINKAYYMLRVEV